MSPTAPEPSEPTVTQEVLQFLAALYEERSISKAARRLRITVPKSSRLFHEARSVFREELFVRHGREMVPTNFMKNLKPKLETALTAIDDLFRDAVFIPKDCERVVRVSAIDYAMEEILTPAILEIRRVAPGVRFDVRPHDRRMLDFLAEGRLDLCIAPGTADETKTILQHPLYPSRHVYVVRKNHPLAQLYREKGSVTSADIEAYEAIRITSIFDDASLLDSTLSDITKQRIAVSMPYMLAAPALLEATDLTLLVPGKLALDFVRKAHLTAIPAPSMKSSFSKTLYWHRRTDKDPALQWIRGMILRFGAAETDETASVRIFAESGASGKGRSLP